MLPKDGHAGTLMDTQDVNKGKEGASDWFKRQAAGRCYRCLAADHKVASCRDPPRCLNCWKSGHRVRFCSLIHPKLATKKQPSSFRDKPRATEQQRAEKNQPPETVTHQETHREISGTKKKGKMEDLLPGAPHLRPDRVEGCALRTAAMREEERMLSASAVLAVAVDANVVPSCCQVEEAARRQFMLGQSKLEVTVSGKATFLLCFGDLRRRREVLAAGEPLFVDGNSFRILPWTRFSAAEASKFVFKARVCLEGVPRHAWQIEAVRSLFPPATSFEGVDHNTPEEKEAACFWIKLWTANLALIAKAGSLEIEEPMLQSPPPFQYPELGVEEEVLLQERMGPVQTLKYQEILIHLDEVLDYSPLPDSPELGSQMSHISGIPSAGEAEEWPVGHTYAWSLGVPDGQRPRARLRIPVQKKLGRPGDRRRDCSPPEDGRSRKRGRDEGSSVQGSQRAWLADGSNSEWYLRGGQGEGSTRGRRRAGSCPPAMAGLAGQAAPVKVGPDADTAHSRRKVVDEAFMAMQVGRQPLEGEWGRVWDPMVQEAANVVCFAIQMETPAEASQNKVGCKHGQAQGMGQIASELAVAQ